MKVTTYPHLREPTPDKVVDVDWDALARSMCTPRVRPADDTRIGMWAPVELLEGTRRASANVVRVHALVLDYDGGHDWSMVLGGLQGCRAVWHTTKRATSEDVRARVVVALASPVDAEHWPAVAAWAMARWRWADPACKDAGRAYYLPVAGLDGSFGCGRIEGDPLDVSHLRVRPRIRPQAVPGRRSTRVDSVVEVYDPAWRIAAGEQRGARAAGDTVKGATCPQCGDRSVWWAIEARSNPRAMCNHRNSCGWTGSIREVPYGV